MKSLALVLLATALPPIPKELAGYVDEFSKACERKVSTPIFFGKAPKGVVAFCAWEEETENKWITVDKRAWAELSDAQKRWTIFHELGHCELGLDHVETFPPSIMNSVVPVNPEAFWSPRLVREFCSSKGTLPLTPEGR